jgi:hypothetical protein
MVELTWTLVGSRVVREGFKSLLAGGRGRGALCHAAYHIGRGFRPDTTMYIATNI